MWKLLTYRARLAVFYALDEAARWRDHIGTEHQMLGLLRDEENVAVQVLHRLSVSPDVLRADIERELTDMGNVEGGGFTPRGKMVLDFAHEEARLLQHHVISTGHILLGLIREGDGLGGSC